jgi:transposase InsO family protein
MFAGAHEDKCVKVVTEEGRDIIEGQDKTNGEFTDKEKTEILKEIHESPIGGHAGMNKTYKRLKHFITWQGMKGDVEEFIQKCEKCQKNKMTQCHTRLPLTITDTPSTVFEKCTIDIVGPLNLSTLGNRYILTVQDELSKFLIAVPMGEQTAEDVAKAFVDNVILIYGIPQVILSDCGSQFLSETFKGICKLLGIKRMQTTSWHPQSNGSNERSHKGLIEYIRNYVCADLNNWDHWVKYATFVHNTTPHRGTNYMPFQLLFGRLPNIPGTLQKEPVTEFYAYDNYIKELESRLRSSFALAQRSLETAKLDNKKIYDRRVFVPKFEIGSKVLVKDESVRRGRSKKLEAPYVGPYEIIKIEGPNLVLRTRKGKEIKIHANRAKLFFA